MGLLCNPATANSHSNLDGSGIATRDRVATTTGAATTKDARDRDKDIPLHQGHNFVLTMRIVWTQALWYARPPLIKRKRSTTKKATVMNVASKAISHMTVPITRTNDSNSHVPVPAKSRKPQLTLSSSTTMMVQPPLPLRPFLSWPEFFISLKKNVTSSWIT
jgi:hypothetical protein